ncbi:MAG: hypothetical protein L0G99_12430 [Propionibacteriales bacterium]|nr:hypothetical protein [Propionibacteriales bacterium]
MITRPAIWLDAEAPNPQWRRPHRLSGLTRLLLVGIPVLVLVLALVTVGLLGGFDDRTDNTIDAAPGTLIETGPLQLTFDRAEAYQQLDYDDKPEEWVVLISGMVRTVDERSTRLDEAFACSDPAQGSMNSEVTVRLPHLKKNFSSAVQPGLPLVPFVLECTYPVDWRPGTEILAGARRQEFTRLDPLGLGDEEGWQPRGGFFRVRLPYEVGEPRPR